MKSIVNNAKMTAMAFMIIFAMASTQTFAGAKDENPVEFRYLGTTNNQPVFLLNLHNSEADEFVITLKTLSGEILYTEKIAGKEIERRYRLNVDEFDNAGMKVEVTSKKNNAKVVYVVSRKSRTVEDVVINKL